MESPKVFISYSWTTPEHEQRVLDIATELVESGIDTILDKWDLKEGDDADVFMEQMVSDPSIQKVLIICDKMYSEKSDKRKGGAGTEAQIISRRVYEQQSNENKFVVAAFEVNEETGKPYLPVYYGSRKYIDFTDPNKYAQKFEELVRWVYNKPLFVKPKLGRVPDYILADDKITLGTTAAYRRAISFVAEGRANAAGAVREYLHTFSENLQSFQLPSCDNHSDYYEHFMTSIKDFVPYRDEWLDLQKNIRHLLIVLLLITLYATMMKEAIQLFFMRHVFQWIIKKIQSALSMATHTFKIKKKGMPLLFPESVVYKI